MSKSFWIDKYRKKYKSKDVSDTHLLNIIRYIFKGGGYLSFLNYDVIDDIYDEALARGLKPEYKRSELKSTFAERKLDYEYAFTKELYNQNWHGQD